MATFLNDDKTKRLERMLKNTIQDRHELYCIIKRYQEGSTIKHSGEKWYDCPSESCQNFISFFKSLEIEYANQT